MCRYKNDVELQTQENILIESVEKAQEVTSTLFIDNCAVSDVVDIKVVAENKAGTASHVAKLSVVGTSVIFGILLPSFAFTSVVGRG